MAKTFNLSGTVGQSGFDRATIELELAQIRPSEMLHINISSEGGNFIEAMKIFEAFDQHKGVKKIHIGSIAGSAAAALALLPDARVSIAENGLLFHHSPGLSFETPQNSIDLKAAAETMEKIENSLIVMLTSRSGKEESEIRRVLESETFFTAQEAKDFGLVDMIVPLTRQKVSISNLVVPKRISAHMNSLDKRSNTMALRDVCSKLGISVKDSATDEDIEKGIITCMESLEKARVEAVKKLEVVDPPKKKEKTALNKRITSILIRDRESQLNELVSEGKVTASVITKLKSQFCQEDGIEDCYDEEGNSIDSFDTVIGALKENEKVINFGGKTKVGELPKGDSSSQESGLVANARKRAEAARE